MWMSPSRRAVVYTVFLVGIRLQAQVEANTEWLAYQDSANDSDGGNEAGGPGGGSSGGSSAVVAVDDVGDGSSNESARGKGKGKGKRGKGEGNGISNHSHGSSVGQLLVWLPDELWVLIVHFLKRAHVGPLDDSGSTSLKTQHDGGGGGGGCGTGASCLGGYGGAGPDGNNGAGGGGGYSGGGGACCDGGGGGSYVDPKRGSSAKATAENLEHGTVVIKYLG